MYPRAVYDKRTPEGGIVRQGPLRSKPDHPKLGMTVCAPGGPGCRLLATPQCSARMPLLVPGVPCTMSGCVSPRDYRGVHREARHRVLPASHPPMPCDPPCLVARPCLYSAREDRQPRPPCGARRRATAGRLVPTARCSPGDRPWPRHPRLDAMPRFPMSR